MCTLGLCLDLGQWEEKKKNLESNFLSIVWFEESQKEKIERRNAMKTWIVTKKIFSFQI